MNPARAGMVNDPAESILSGYKVHAFGINAKMWTPHVEHLALAATKASRIAVYRKLFDYEPEKATIGEIRHVDQLDWPHGRHRHGSGQLYCGLCGPIGAAG